LFASSRGCSPASDDPGTSQDSDPIETITPAELRALPEEHRKYIPAPFLADTPAADAPQAPEAVENKGPESAPTATTEQGDTGSEPSKATEAETNKVEVPATAPPPSSEPALDLSAIPEAIRSEVSGKLSLAAQKELNDSYLRRDRFNRGLQEQAADKKRADAATADADKWQKVARNPKAAKAALAVLEAEESGAGEDDDNFDPITATPEDWKRERARIKEQAYKAGAEAATQTIREKVDEPRERASATEKAYFEMAAEAGLDADAALAVAEKAIAHYEKQPGPDGKPFLTRQQWTPAHVAALAPPWFELAKSARNKPAATNGHSEPPPIPKVAAPGRGGGVTAPPPLPRFMREGRTWPGSDEERAEYAVYLANQHTGSGRLTVAELEEAINGSTRGR
jgi:hypothetical protein